MREKSACAALNRTPSANGGAVPASDHLLIARRSAQADDHAAKTLLFEVPTSELFGSELYPQLCEFKVVRLENGEPQVQGLPDPPAE